MNSPRPAALRQTWLVIFGALTFSVLTYGLVCYFIEHSPKPRSIDPTHLATARPILMGLALLSLVVSIAWLRFKVDGKIGDGGRELATSPAEFQTNTIIALALSELCAVLGFLLFQLGGSLREFAPFAFGTFFVNLAFVLPRGLQFWSAYEKTTRN